MNSKLKILFLLVGMCLAIGTGCIGSGGSNNTNEDPLPNPNPAPSPSPSPTPIAGIFPLTCADTAITQGDNDDGSHAACLPPALAGTFRYFKLGTTIAEVTPGDPDHSTEWDFAVRGSAVKTNGGENGIGNVSVAYEAGADFFAETQAPSTIYYTDLADTVGGFFEGIDKYVFMTYPGPESDENPSTGPLYFGMWRYTLFLVPQHTISARNVVYTLHSTDGTYYKIKIVSGYKDLSQAGTPEQLGWLSLYWDSVGAP